MTILLAATGLILLGLLIAQQHKHERRLDQIASLALQAQQPHPDLAALIALVENLCQRVQAPEQAVIDHATRELATPGPEAVNPADDNSYWQALETKDQLAKRLFEEELSGTT